MGRHVTTGFEQGQAGDQFGVAINHSITQRWVIPVVAGIGEARVAASGDVVVFALDDQFGVGEGVVVAAMVYVEMRADEHCDVIGAKFEVPEMPKNVLFIS